MEDYARRAGYLAQRLGPAAAELHPDEWDSRLTGAQLRRARHKRLGRGRGAASQQAREARRVRGLARLARHLDLRDVLRARPQAPAQGATWHSAPGAGAVLRRGDEPWARPDTDVKGDLARAAVPPPAT